MHYYKFNIPAWVLSTAHLSLEEEACYLRLINHYYDTEQPIPLETQQVFRRLRMGSNVDTAQLILDEFFDKTEKGYTHKKCDELLKDYRKTAKRSKENGAKGGRPKKGAASSVSQEKPSGLLDETQDEPKHNLNYKLITNNQELETNINTLVDETPTSVGDGDLFETGKPDKKPKVPACPHQDIIDLYHEILPECQSVLPDSWRDSTREADLRNRWRQSKIHQDLDFWGWFFTGVKSLRNGFYVSDEGGPWRANIGWMIKKTNFINLCEQIASSEGQR